MGAKETLKNYLMEGIADDLFAAEQTYALLKQIGQNADGINQAKFGALFGPLQVVLSNAFFLSVAKLFEKPNRKYPTRSIPSVLQLLERSSHELLIEERMAVMRRLAAAGMTIESVEKTPDSEITLRIVQFYTASLPSIELATWCEMSKSLSALVTRRDKVVAHNEMIDRSTLPQTSWADIERLMSYAKGFIDVVGIGYISMCFAGDDGHYFLTQDARVASHVLSKLLIKAGALENVPR
jgi:AbiU2